MSLEKTGLGALAMLAGLALGLPRIHVAQRWLLDSKSTF
jgi:hypothetical protein